MVIYIGVPAAMISLATMAWVLTFAEHQARRLGEAEMAEMAASAAARLEEYIGTASRIADTRAKFVSRIGEFSEDQIYGMLKDSLGVSERIYGAAMAFEPGSFKQDNSLFAPYAFRGTEGVFGSG